MPESFRDHLRLAAWALLNVPFPDELRVRYARQVRPTLGAFSVYRTVTRWRRLAEWLLERGVVTFAGLTAAAMNDFVVSLNGRVTENTVGNDKIALLRLWCIGLQLPELALPEAPEWLTEEVSYGAGRATWSSDLENATEPIEPATMTALLGWAIATVDSCATPIVDGFAFYRRPYVAGKAYTRVGIGPDKAYSRGHALATLDAHLAWLQAAGEALPGLPNGDLPPVTVDARLLACQFGFSLEQVRGWVEVRPQVQAHASRGLEVQPITLGLNEEASRILPARVNLRELPALAGLLEAACFIVIGYLTGMRVGEVMALEAGSLTPSSADGGWMLIRARHFKGVRDDEGIHNPNGELRSTPWVAVAPVVRAIQAMERLRSGHGLLFPAARQRVLSGRPRARSRYAMINLMEQFIAHINTLHPGAIPPDSKGRITGARFRRTLAWHIANQPNGLVALAVQYGHLRTAISEGYASRTRSGLQDLIDLETARTMAVNLSEAHERLRAGEGVSGPAAPLFTQAARVAHEQFGGMVTSSRQAASLLSNKSLQVYENEQAFVWCNFRRESALCLRDKPDDATATPRLDRCQPGCGNIARTDAQSAKLRICATELTRQAAVMPEPAALRVLSFAGSLVDRADRHDATRIAQGRGSDADRR